MHNDCALTWEGVTGIRRLVVVVLAMGGLVLASCTPAPTPTPDPDPDPGPRRAVEMSGGRDHTCALMDDDTVQCWGSNTSGQLGTVTSGWTSGVPAEVEGLTGAVAIATGDFHTCAVLDDGTAQCWGLNDYGQLGAVTDDSVSGVPVQVEGLTGAVAISAGSYHSCALLDDGTAQCWGRNDSGQLGDGTDVGSNTSVVVSGLTGVVEITSGEMHSCAALEDGSVRCWGNNQVGQLGDGATGNSNVPVVVSGTTGPVSDVVTLASRSTHTCVVLGDTSVRCWGANWRGGLGDGTTSISRLAVTVPGLTGVTEVGTGRHHSCALISDGSLRCWGGNDNQLGNGTNVDSKVPVPVSGVTDAVALTGGDIHSCAVLSDGSATCWGSNGYGQLGDGAGMNSNVPVVVQLLT